MILLDSPLVQMGLMRFVTIENPAEIILYLEHTNQYIIFNMIESFVTPIIGVDVRLVHLDDIVFPKRDAFWMKLIIHVNNGFNEIQINQASKHGYRHTNKPTTT